MTEKKPTNGLLIDWLNLTNHRRTKKWPSWLTIDGSKSTNDWWQTLHESFSQYHQGETDQSRLTDQTDKHFSLASEDDFCSGCWNVSHQQQFFSELPSPRLSHYMNYWKTLNCKDNINKESKKYHSVASFLVLHVDRKYHWNLDPTLTGKCTPDFSPYPSCTTLHIPLHLKQF